MIRMGRRVARAGALSLLLLGGFASSLYAARPSAHTGATTVTLATATPSTATVPVTSTGATSAGTTTTAATTSGTTTTSTAPAVLAFSGHGWGHGLGLAQWGAYGYALHGWSYRRILAHYYRGTTLGTSGVTTVRVLVASEKRTTISSTVPFTVTGSGGAAAQLDPGKLVLGKTLAVAGHPDLRPPLAITAAAPLSVDGRAYRGSLALSTDGTTVSTVDLVGLEDYLKGVVPAEMPSTWAPEALKAQAVAARSVCAREPPRRATVRSLRRHTHQAYGGIAAESAAADSAVDATRRTVVLYHGKVADTLFHSTSGGRTVSALEATGGPRAVPGLGGRPVRHALALPRLGAGAGRRLPGGEGAQALGAHRLARSRRRPVRAASSPSRSAAPTARSSGSRAPRCAPRSSCARPGSRLAARAAAAPRGRSPTAARPPSRAARSVQRAALTLEAKTAGARLGTGRRPRAGRRRHVLDDREAAGEDVVPARRIGAMSAPAQPASPSPPASPRPWRGGRESRGSSRPVVPAAAAVRSSAGTARPGRPSPRRSSTPRAASRFGGSLRRGHLSRPGRAGPRPRRRSSRRRSTCRDPARSAAAAAVRGADRAGRGARVRQHRAARREAVVPRGRPQLELLAVEAAALPRARRRDRLRDRRRRTPI